MAYDFIISERLDGVGFVTLNRPDKLNALSYDLVRELDDALTGFEEDDAIKAVVITGAGERAFSAGADIHEMADLSASTGGAPGPAWRDFLACRQLFETDHRRDQWARSYGGAAVLSSSLDIRIGCEKTQFRFLAASYGRVNSSWSLPLLVGWPKAKELLFTGRVVHAEEAERIGLLNMIVPAARLRDSAIELAQSIAKNDARMVQGIKAAAARRPALPLHERCELRTRLGRPGCSPAIRDGFGLSRAQGKR